MLLASVVLTLAVVAPADERPALRGTVVGSDGVAIPGARVFVESARPRAGLPFVCSACTSDSGRDATTGVNGRFEIPRVDPSLFFRVVAVFPGREPVAQDEVDPRAGELTFNLAPRTGSPGPHRLLRGRVVGPDGGGVPRALVEGLAVLKKDGVNESITLAGREPVVAPALSDQNGDVETVLRQDAEAVFLRVSAPGYARRAFERVPTGSDSQPLPLTRGTTVRGRVLAGGKGEAGVTVMLCQRDRSPERFVGTYAATTDGSGKFQFADVAPDEPLVLFGPLHELEGRGCLVARKVRSGAGGASVDLGDLSLEPCARVAGRVVLSDGKTLSPGAKVVLGRQQAPDGVEIPVGADGAFEIAGVPAEPVSLGVAAAGYVLSAANPSLHPVTLDALVGRVQGETQLAIELEPSAQGPKRRPTPKTPAEWKALDELWTASERIAAAPLSGVDERGLARR